MIAAPMIWPIEGLEFGGAGSVALRHSSGGTGRVMHPEPDLSAARRGLEAAGQPMKNAGLGPLGLSQRPGRRRGKATHGDGRRRPRDRLTDVHHASRDRASGARSRRAPRPGGW